MSPLEGTRARRQKLKDGWCFDCNCQRCLDPTELGTHFSSAICGSCSSVLVLHSDDQALTCQLCQTIKSVQELEIHEEQLERRLSEIQTNPDELNEVLDQYRHILHPNHHLLMAAKRYLLYSLPRNDRRRSALAKDLLPVFDVITPGLTKERGTVYTIKIFVRYFFSLIITFYRNDNFRSSWWVSVFHFELTRATFSFRDCFSIGYGWFYRFSFSHRRSHST